jgi:hypothetical protein
MKRLVILIVLALASLSLAAASAPIPFVVYQGASGTLYALSPGVPGGSCTPANGGMQCTAPGGNSSSAYSSTGCGVVAGQGLCLIVPPGWSPPAGTNAGSTLECPGKAYNYELSPGNGSGSCTANNNTSMTCSDEQGGGSPNNTAQATCQNGCGEVKGSGSCKAVKR